MMFVMLTWQNRCHGWGAETAEDAKNAAETAKKMAAEVAHEAKDKTASWTGWISDKIST